MAIVRIQWLSSSDYLICIECVDGGIGSFIFKQLAVELKEIKNAWAALISNILW